MTAPLPAKLPANLLDAAGVELPPLAPQAHKTLAKLIASGISPEECAEAVGLSPRQVVAIINWSTAFRKELDQILATQKSLDPQLLLRSFMVPAILTLHSVMTNEKASASDRLNAARELLNRTLGKPAENKPKSTADPVDRLAELERERQKLQSMKQSV
jgi:hypothetical protein